jgi:hypothetical protein
LKGRHFSSDAKVIAAAETWLDGQPSDFFLIGLQKLEFGRCSVFLPGRAKDLSAPRYTADVYATSLDHIFKYDFKTFRHKTVLRRSKSGEEQPRLLLCILI